MGRCFGKSKKGQRFGVHQAVWSGRGTCKSAQILFVSWLEKVHFPVPKEAGRHAQEIEGVPAEGVQPEDIERHQRVPHWGSNLDKGCESPQQRVDTHVQQNHEQNQLQKVGIAQALWQKGTILANLAIGKPMATGMPLAIGMPLTWGMPLAIGMPPHLKGMVPNNGNVGKKGSMVRAHIYIYTYIHAHRKK